MATNLIIRKLDPDLHKALKIRAAQEGKSLEALLKEILAQAVKEGALPKTERRERK